MRPFIQKSFTRSSIAGYELHPKRVGFGVDYLEVWPDLEPEEPNRLYNVPVQHTASRKRLNGSGIGANFLKTGAL